MARILRCDVCGTQVSPDANGLPPAGWICLQVMNGTGGILAEVCGIACAIMWLRQRGNMI